METKETRLSFIKWFKVKADRTYIAYAILGVLCQYLLFKAAGGPLTNLKEILEEDGWFDTIFCSLFIFLPSAITVISIVLGYIQPYKAYLKSFK